MRFQAQSIFNGGDRWMDRDGWDGIHSSLDHLLAVHDACMHARARTHTRESQLRGQ
jgi:hypothetical protein